MVDVGARRKATFIEELIARLEQHGIHRITQQDSDDNDDELPWTTYKMQGNPDREEPVDENNLDREPYYYQCVVCCKDLSEVSTIASSFSTLEDLHYHCGTAQHREATSFMSHPDSLATLHQEPQMDTQQYTSVFVNGHRLLISRSPGGGGMFYPLPHEADAEQRLQGTSDGGQVKSMWPPCVSSTFWYSPQQHLSPGCYQHVRIRAGARRNMIESPRGLLQCEHIPWAEYCTQSTVFKGAEPPSISLMALKRRRLESAETLMETNEYPRLCFERISTTSAGEEYFNQFCVDEGAEAGGAYGRLAVSEGDCFRLAYVDEEYNNVAPKESPADSDLPPSQVLTVELLRQMFPAAAKAAESSGGYEGSKFSLHSFGSFEGSV